MKNFKFFKKNVVTDYNGELALEAVRFFHDYILGRYQHQYEIRTEDAVYRIIETTWDNGMMSRGVMLVYPTNTNIKITFWVSGANYYPFITGHSIEYEGV